MEANGGHEITYLGVMITGYSDITEVFKISINKTVALRIEN